MVPSLSRALVGEVPDRPSDRVRTIRRVWPSRLLPEVGDYRGVIAHLP
jgi:hypothetical protein